MALLAQQLENILVKGGCVSPKDFQFAVHQAEVTGHTIEEAIVDNGILSDQVLGLKISEKLGLPFIDLKKVKVPEELIRILSPATTRDHQVVVFGSSLENGRFKIATHKIDNDEFISKFEKKMGRKADLHYATPGAIKWFLGREKRTLKESLGDLLEKFSQIDDNSEQDIVELVDFFLERAYHSTASDIHLNPDRNGVSIRFRIDGVVHPVVVYPREIHERIVNRIKVLAQLRLDEKKKTQGGRFDHQVNSGCRISIRVSVVPVIYGENVVMRLLVEGRGHLFLDETGLSRSALKTIDRALKRSHGFILSVGPSGCGKTTTIYGMLQVLNQPDTNIVTIEDPVEYSVDGVQQVQTDPVKELTFANGLRSLLRQDPDVVVVGEIRDKETAGIAVNAAMTGHLVLSSIHANDAATVFPRFTDMNVEPFLLASSVNLVISQRLVRRICHACRQSYSLSGKEMILVKEDKDLASLIRRITGLNVLNKVRIYRGEGCKLCHGSGYSGRIGIFELLEPSDAIRSMLVAKAPAKEIRRQALAEGMTSISEDGLRKVLLGETTLEEFIREINS